MSAGGAAREFRAGGFGEETGAIVGDLVDFFQQGLVEGDVHPLGSAWDAHPNQRDRDHLNVRIGSDGLDRRGLREGIAILNHQRDMASERLVSLHKGFFRRVAGADQAREVRKGHAVDASRLLFQDRRVEQSCHLICFLAIGRLSHLSLTPDAFSMLFNVPMGRSFTGCGMVIFPLFGLVLEMHMATGLTNAIPAIRLDDADDLL